MYQVSVEISGTQPLLMHNGQLANPLNEYARQIKAITSKRTKTDADYEEIYRLEFYGGLYYDSKVGAYLPGEMFDAVIRNGAAILRKATSIQRGVTTREDKVPVVYSGPRALKDMYPVLADIRGVSAQGRKGGSRTMRCRPIFKQPWSAAFTLFANPEVISPEDLHQCVDLAGQRIGVGDYIPRFGRFDIAKWEVVNGFA